jgi:hypothetical protein
VQGALYTAGVTEDEDSEYDALVASVASVSPPSAAPSSGRGGRREHHEGQNGTRGGGRKKGQGRGAFSAPSGIHRVDSGRGPAAPSQDPATGGSTGNKKRCTKCKAWLGRDAFSGKQWGKSPRPRCMACVASAEVGDASETPRAGGPTCTPFPAAKPPARQDVATRLGDKTSSSRK